MPVLVGLLIVLALAALVVIPRIPTAQQPVTPTRIGITIRQPNVDTVSNVLLCVDGTGNPSNRLTVQLVTAENDIIQQVSTSVSKQVLWKAFLRVPPQSDRAGLLVARLDGTEILASIPVSDWSVQVRN